MAHIMDGLKFFAEMGLLIITTVLLHIFLIPLTLTSAPFAVYRIIIRKLQPRFRPDLGKILNLSATYLASAYTHPLAYQVIFHFTIQGKGTEFLESFKMDFQRLILNRREKLSSELIYPEFQQIPSSWMGYFFWRNPEAEFSLEKHFMVRNLLAGADFEILKRDVLVEGFPGNGARPQWVLYAVQHEVEELTTFLFKFHHVYFDVFSTYKFLAHIFKEEGGAEHESGSNSPRQEVGRGLAAIQLLVRILRTPFEFIQSLNLFIQTKWRFRSWEHNYEIPSSSDQIQPYYYKTLRMCELKQVASHFGVGVSAVILATFCGALRATFLKNGLSLPSNISMSTTVARPGHPNQKLRNHAGGLSIGFPVGEECPVARLQKIFTRLRSLTVSSFSVQYILLFMAILTIFPNPLRKHIFGQNNPFVPFFLYSGMQGPKGKITWRGKAVKYVQFFGGGSFAKIPFLLGSMVTPGGTSIELMISGLTPPGPLNFLSGMDLHKDFLNHVAEELRILLDIAIDDNEKDLVHNQGA